MFKIFLEISHIKRSLSMKISFFFDSDILLFFHITLKVLSRQNAFIFSQIFPVFGNGKFFYELAQFSKIVDPSMFVVGVFVETL